MLTCKHGGVSNLLGQSLEKVVLVRVQASLAYLAGHVMAGIEKSLEWRGSGGIEWSLQIEAWPAEIL